MEVFLKYFCWSMFKFKRQDMVIKNIQRPYLLLMTDDAYIWMFARLNPLFSCYLISAEANPWDQGFPSHSKKEGCSFCED